MKRWMITSVGVVAAALAAASWTLGWGLKPSSVAGSYKLIGFWSHALGRPLCSPGQFDLPMGVAIGPDGSVYVSDYDQDRIHRFDSHGRFLRQWGTGGKGARQFSSPVGLATDAQGRIYAADFFNKVVWVADTYNYRLQMFAPDGSVRRTFGWYVLWLIPRPHDGATGFSRPR